MVWLPVPVLVAVITDGDGPTSCATCPFMTLQNTLNSPQLTWKWMEMSPGVFRNTQWCDLNCGWPFGGRDGCNNLHLFMGKSANKHLMWRCYDTFGPDVNLRQTLAANIYILENELHHPVVLNFSSCKCYHVKTKERRGKEKKGWCFKVSFSLRVWKRLTVFSSVWIPVLYICTCINDEAHLLLNSTAGTFVCLEIPSDIEVFMLMKDDVLRLNWLKSERNCGCRSGRGCDQSLVVTQITGLVAL